MNMPIEVWAAIAGAATAVVAPRLMGNGNQSAPQTQAPIAPPTQDAKAPDTGQVRASNMGAGQAGGAPGVAQTMLTGPSGIDPKLLKLGKNTLLGG